jgi:hypothetical protein
VYNSSQYRTCCVNRVIKVATAVFSIAEVVCIFHFCGIYKPGARIKLWLFVFISHTGDSSNDTAFIQR